MSQSPITVTYSLEDVLKEIKQDLSQINQKLDKQSEQIAKQSEEIATIKATLQAQQPFVQKIPDLAEKVGELKNWRQIVVIFVAASVSGVIGWLLRSGNLRP
jgi:septal ring factor EnvC (AmiA/AmiB activator)